MNSGVHQPARYRLDLSLSPAHALPGHTTTLSWKVLSHGVQVAGVQLAMYDDGGMRVIERAAVSGSRQLIFARPGVFAFSLAATFSDGTRRQRRVRITVGDSAGNPRPIHPGTGKAGGKL